jgi:hypothetical protein
MPADALCLEVAGLGRVRFPVSKAKAAARFAAWRVLLATA